MVNATPARVVVWPGGAAGDDYNPLPCEKKASVCYYGDLFSPGSTAFTHNQTTESQFVSWCEEIHCTAIMELPGEIDNPKLGSAIVNYTEKNLTFTPAYWEIGNEPELWNETGCPWTSWGNTVKCPLKDTSPGNYSDIVHAYIAYIEKYEPEPNAFIGIAATAHKDGSWPTTTWVTDTVEENGPEISAIAIHVYPAGIDRNCYDYDNATGQCPVKVPPDLTQFYGQLTNPKGPGLPFNYTLMQQTVAAAATKYWPHDDLRIQVFVTEIGSGLSNYDYGSFSLGFPGALDLAAQMVQGIDLGVPNIDLFAAVFNTSNSWVSLTGTEYRPDYSMYADILSRLGTIAYPVSLSWSGTGAPFNGSIYALATIDPGDHDREDVLVVNADTVSVATQELVGCSGGSCFYLNTTSGDPITFNPPAFVPNGSYPQYQAGEPVEIWNWSGTFENTNRDSSGGFPNATWVSAPGAPIGQYYGAGLPATFTIPAQGVALFEWYPGGAEPVNVSTERPAGSDQGLRWFANIGGQTVTSAGSSLSDFLPTGAYAVSAPAIPLPTERHIENPVQRLGAFLPSTLDLGNEPGSLSISYVFQWKIDLGVSPNATGEIAPDPTWANGSSPLSIEALPAPGYAFDRWTGFMEGGGTGAANSTSAELTIVPHGVVGEIAHFVVGTNVTFEETGLPAGTDWSVSVNGATHQSAGVNVSFDLIEGRTTRFSVTQIPGYWSIPGNSSVKPAGGEMTVPVTFHAHTPPLPKFPLIFVEQGLPTGTKWAVTAAGVTENSSATSISFNETVERNVGFSIGNISGYRSVPRNSSVDEEAPKTVVNVTFILRTPPGVQAPLIFVEQELPIGTNWTVTAANVTHNSTGASITFMEVVGRNVGFSIWVLPGYRSVPRNSSVVEELNVTIVNVTFTALTPPKPQFPVYFQEQGLPDGIAWNVTVRSHVTGDNQTLNSTGAPIMFDELAGYYGYVARTVSGYAATTHSTAFRVTANTTLTVSVAFRLVLYPVIFEEVGLDSGINWTVDVGASDPTPSHGSWATANLSNGSYSYRIPGTLDYNPTPDHGTVTVTGTITKVEVNFERAMYEVRFVTEGLGGAKNWNVRLADLWSNSTSSNASFAEPNGTYTFDVQAPAGFYPFPSHGNVTVVGPQAGSFARTPWMLVEIDFKPSSPQIPSAWWLGGKAVVVTVVLVASMAVGFILVRRVIRRPPSDEAPTG